MAPSRARGAGAASGAQWGAQTCWPELQDLETGRRHANVHFVSVRETRRGLGRQRQRPEEGVLHASLTPDSGLGERGGSLRRQEVGPLRSESGAHRGRVQGISRDSRPDYLVFATGYS